MSSTDLYQSISLSFVKFCSGTNRKFPLEIFIEVRACNNKNLKNLVRRYLCNSGKLLLLPYTKDFGRITRF